MIEKESNIIDEMKYVLKDHGVVEILDSMGVDELFEKEYQTVELIDINCRMGKLKL